MDRPLMPKATAVWLVENTSLTFDQIAEFCGLHALEVKGIADGEVAAGIRGLDPVGAGMLSRDEIRRCEADPKTRLKIARSVAADVKPPWYSLTHNFVMEAGTARLPRAPITGKAEGERPQIPHLEPA